MAIFTFIDELEGTFVLRKPCGGFVNGIAHTGAPVLPTAPKLSTLCESYVIERGSGLSQERADTIRATVRDFIAITTDKPIAEYGRGDAGGYKETMLGLPGNWKKGKGLREHGIIEAAARARVQGLPRQGSRPSRRSGRSCTVCSTTQRAIMKT